MKPLCKVKARSAKFVSLLRHRFLDDSTNVVEAGSERLERQDPLSRASWSAPEPR
jgi:hypothetical protein